MIQTATAGRQAAPLLAAVLFLAAGCNISQTPVTSGAATPRAAGSAPAAPAGVVVANGHGWTSAGLDGPIPAAGTCHVRTAADGEPLPDPACTPGDIFPNYNRTECQVFVKGDLGTTQRQSENRKCLPPLVMGDVYHLIQNLEVFIAFSL